MVTGLTMPLGQKKNVYKTILFPLTIVFLWLGSNGYILLMTCNDY